MASSSNKSSSVSLIAKQRVREELKKISDTKVLNSELQKLREEIIPPKTPLPKQRDIVTEKAEKHETELGTHFTSLDLLQDTIKGLETEVSRLLQESTQAQAELKRRRQKLNDGLIDLLRLQKLIEQINKEISDKTFEFESKLDEMENKRTQILNDPNLTEEEKEKLLADLDKEMNELKQAHASTLNLLQNEKEKLKDEARMEAQILQKALHDLELEHQSGIEELERAKIGASPSEILKIEAQILEKQQQHANKLEILDKSATTKKYFVDDRGRYYLNEEGVKVYRRDSNASEYMIDSDGKLVSMLGEASGKKSKQDERSENQGQRSVTEATLGGSRRQQKLHVGLMKLLRLHDMIEEIGQELSQKDVGDIVSVQREREKLKDEARIEAQLLEVIFKELEDEHLNVMDELDKLNIGPSASEILKMVEKYATMTKYFFDDKGRFYFDQNGDRVYKDYSIHDLGSDDEASGVRTQSNLKRRCEKLRCGLLKLLKLHKLIEQIDKEICAETVKSSGRCKTPEVKQKPLKLAKGVKLTNEKKKEVLASLDQQLCELKQVHASTLRLQKNIKQIDKEMFVRKSERAKQDEGNNRSQKQATGLICLQSKREKLKDEARTEAQILQSLLADLKKDNMDAVEELEKLKVGHPPSELLKIVENCATANKYFFDDEGRKNLNENGTRMYQQNPCSAECIKGFNGEFSQASVCPSGSSMNSLSQNVTFYVTLNFKGFSGNQSSFDFSGSSNDFCQCTADGKSFLLYSQRINLQL